uniref:Uncharacterized protein n=1 Tax=Setaria viridis TaxID=4556 RepID=A0A4U6U7R8_SETVI|nr:hypothetical protein SEVIR_7G231750v2 [Setaria viridis]
MQAAQRQPLDLPTLREEDATVNRKFVMIIGGNQFEPQWWNSYVFTTTSQLPVFLPCRIAVVHSSLQEQILSMERV